jgi:hypothetical protein
LIPEGAALLERLDADRVPVTAAFWLLNPDSRTWKYYLASPDVTKFGPLQVYRRLQEYVGQSALTLQDIAAVSPHDPFVQLLGAAIHTAPDVIGGMRFTGNTISGVFIEDAYIYRMT